MSVLVVDYGMGNLGSVSHALEECGARVTISDRAADTRSATHVILPGVGAFRDGMTRLREGGWIDAIGEAVAQGIPTLGICLGMQLFAARGEEGGGATDGIGLIPGDVTRLVPQKGERIPHIGWNEVYPDASEPLFAGIEPGTDFYFVHSFHFCPADRRHVAATSPYCDSFVSAVRMGSIVGVQFHPEKSGRAGMRLLRNFLDGNVP
jgi:imidazole glycerol-phosphate synthase subunit HisH